MPSKLHEWIVTVDHKRLGIMYIATSLFFFAVAGVLAALMRAQLAFPNGKLLPPEVFNRLFTMHGTTMVFLVGMPFFAGLANYLVPLMIGARDMAFPRLNAFGYWMFLFGGFLLYFSYIAGEGLAGHGTAPDVGWFAYAPLTERAFSRGTSTDYWILSIIVSGIGTTASAINVIATIISMRCKGMTLARMPLFVWLMLVVSCMVIMALPPLTAAQIMLLAGPVSWRALFRYAGGRFGHTVAAFLLAVRAPGGLHPDAARVRLRFGNHPGFLAQTDFRTRGDDRGYPRDRICVGECMGAPHVCRRNVCRIEHLLCSLNDAGRNTDGNQDLQLAGHHVRRKAPLRYAHAVLHRIPVPVPDCRSDRNHAGRRPVQLAANRLLFCGGAFSLHAHRRHAVRLVRRRCITGFPKRPARC